MTSRAHAVWSNFATRATRCDTALVALDLRQGAPYRKSSWISGSGPNFSSAIRFGVSRSFWVSFGSRKIDTTRPWRDRETLTNMPCARSCGAMLFVRMKAEGRRINRIGPSPFILRLSSSSFISWPEVRHARSRERSRPGRLCAGETRALPETDWSSRGSADAF